MITIDPEREIGQIHKNIFGHFIEHIGRCIYGGVYDQESPRSDTRGFRLDVLRAVNKIGCPILRWPGGNFASNYHWQDGVGPVDKRPVKLDLAWLGKEPNFFGTDEFIQYCRAVHAEPYICLNLGTGHLEEALNWVEYCNGTGDTQYARLRKKNGQANPYHVRYWGVGNETYGSWQVGHTSATDYARNLREHAKLIKKLNQSNKIIAVGSDNPEWDLEVLSVAGEHIDYLSNHQYLGNDDYYSTVAGPYWIEKRLRLLESAISIANAKRGFCRKINIAMDEWNIWYRAGKETLWEENYSLKDGLFAAGVFLVLFRMGNTVTLANLAQLVNTLGAIHAEREGIFLTPIYLAFKLLASQQGFTVLDTFVDTESYDIRAPVFFGRVTLSLSEVPYLDACATLSKDNKFLYVSAVNYHEESPAKSTIKIQNISSHGGVQIRELNGPNPWAVNTLQAPDAVEIKQKQIEITTGMFEYEFPPHSATVLQIKL